MTDPMAPYVLLALQAVGKVRDAYEVAEADPNPYAVAMVTQTLAEGNLIALDVARRAIRHEDG